MDHLETIALDESDKFTYVSTLLSSEEKEQLQHVLLGNIDVFAWSHLDMAGIDPSLASHKLNSIASAKPIRQKIIHYLPKSSLDYSDRGRQSSKSRFYQGGKVSWMACQHGGRPKEGC